MMKIMSVVVALVSLLSGCAAVGTALQSTGQGLQGASNNTDGDTQYCNGQNMGGGWQRLNCH